MIFYRQGKTRFCSTRPISKHNVECNKSFKNSSPNNTRKRSAKLQRTFQVYVSTPLQRLAKIYFSKTKKKRGGGEEGLLVATRQVVESDLVDCKV